MRPSLLSILLRWLLFLFLAGLLNAVVQLTLKDCFYPYVPWDDRPTEIVITLIIIGVASYSPVRQLIQRFRQYRHLPGHCQQCHYDLRAHKPGDKCPECGCVVTKFKEPVMKPPG